MWLGLGKELAFTLLGLGIEQMMPEPQPPPSISVPEAVMGGVLIAVATAAATACYFDWCQGGDEAPEPEPDQ